MIWLGYGKTGNTNLWASDIEMGVAYDACGSTVISFEM